MVPVNDGLANETFNSNAVWDAFEMGIFASDVFLFTLPNPTIDLVIPDTVPVHVGEASDAFKCNIDCVAVEMGLFASLVSST